VSEHHIAMRQVMRVDQSPMNPKQWCLTMSCGHETWVTRRTRPKIRFTACAKCGESKVWKDGEK
jgi:hypothetical protein